MSIRDFTANVISATKVVPDGNFKDSKASGVWDINEALDLIKGGNWPNAANINPAAFVDGLFSIDLYTGTGSSGQVVTTGLDLSNNEGLVWIKRRDGTEHNDLYDTVRGATKDLRSNATTAEGTEANGLQSFTSTGFTVGGDGLVSVNNGEYVSWSFRSQPKFFDVVTYTGDNTSNRAISHNLGSTPGMIICKSTSSGQWGVWHRSLSGNNGLRLDSDAAAGGSILHDSSTVNSTSFEVSSGGYVLDNQNQDYVAYLFAHNNDDGGFGEPGDQDIIKCGSYTGNGNATGPVVTLGFEPQLIMIKRASGGTGDWDVYDNMRGIPTGAGEKRLEWNTSDAESTAGADRINLSSTGFSIATTNSNVNTNGDTYIYMAIRRGGMQTPTAASDVFEADAYTGTNSANTTEGSITIDLNLIRSRDNNSAENGFFVFDRVRGDDEQLETFSSDAKRGSFAGTYYNLDQQVGFSNGSNTSYFQNPSADYISYIWKRARGYFDIVAYIGDGNTNRSVTHNLGVVPEMMWIKNRDEAGVYWVVYHKDLGANKEIILNATDGVRSVDQFNNTAPTSSVFTVGTPSGPDLQYVNKNNINFVNYLFATAPGVSKVGSFTQSGATNVDCGFTGDTPSFILLKRTDADTGDWLVFDSTRGIVAGNDPSLDLNTTDAEVTNADVVDPYSGGFATTSSLTNGDYIFYAIAATS